METVRSTDGTAIAYTRSGSGPALVLVGGGLSDHRAVAPLLPHLEPHFTVYAFDRRGRGESGPAGPAAPAREVEDVAALVAAASPPVHLFGHSSGAVLALHAALAGVPVATLALYEPPFVLDGSRQPTPDDLADRLDALIAAGDRAGALSAFLREGVALSEPEVKGLRAAPLWPAWLELAHTVAEDVRVVGRGALPPREQLAAMTVPTLVLQGGASPAWMRSGTTALAAALPRGRLAVLDGQGHAAAQQAPELLASELARFTAAP